MERMTRAISKILAAFLTMLMATMVINVTWQVISRFVMKNPSSYTEELAGFLLIWIGLLGASWAYYTKAHLGIDVLTAKATGLKRKLIEISINFIVLMFALFVMVIGGIRLVKLTFSLGQISPALGIEMGTIYLVIPLAGILMIYFAIHFIVIIVRSK
jgi:TRAP-type C4-dicarboxylate transport system permease small subunit